MYNLKITAIKVTRLPKTHRHFYGFYGRLWGTFIHNTLVHYILKVFYDDIYISLIFLLTLLNFLYIFFLKTILICIYIYIYICIY